MTTTLPVFGGDEIDGVSAADIMVQVLACFII